MSVYVFVFPCELSILCPFSIVYSAVSFQFLRPIIDDYIFCSIFAIFFLCFHYSIASLMFCVLQRI